ncbi:hypothetical protein [Chryseobacterium hispalense]|uniref:hypothetical protein n=1 Tax=Chryseobacterium hispalense TaxID=1453492 RepID=UPI00391C508E
MEGYFYVFTGLCNGSEPFFNHPATLFNVLSTFQKDQEALFNYPKTLFNDPELSFISLDFSFTCLDRLYNVS